MTIDGGYSKVASDFKSRFTLCKFSVCKSKRSFKAILVVVVDWTTELKQRLVLKFFFFNENK